ncbi:MAG: hypothetical protein AUK44_06775 [Porphyromonadaceae bacterium CG2_30_38_12]|nr:MAG: hypothetical protein AUK44_06775 [Porphyromonadaceae bacterium CG2_30_38_12]
MKLYSTVYLLIISLILVTEYFLYKHAKNRNSIQNLLSYTSAGIFLLLFTAIKFWYEKNDNYQLTVYVMWFNYSFILLYTAKILYLLWRLRFRNESSQWYKLTIIVIIVLAESFLLYATFVSSYALKTKQLTFTFSKLPPSFEALKIVQITDLHLGSLMHNYAYAKQMVAIINQQHADIVVFTGDFVNNFAAEALGWDTLFVKIKAQHGKYAVLGNHDYGDYSSWESEIAKKQNFEAILQAYQHAGFELLNNSHVYIRNGSDSIALIGVEYYHKNAAKNHTQLAQAMRGINAESFKILLTHNPMHWGKEVKEKTNIDLSLAGHTHTAQMGLEIGAHTLSPSALIFQYSHGLYQAGNQYLYISSGVGFVGLPLRLGISPEITVISLRRKS